MIVLYFSACDAIYSSFCVQPKLFSKMWILLKSLLIYNIYLKLKAAASTLLYKQN